MLGHLRAHALGLGALLVDLVHRHHDRHLRRAGVVDRLLGLRLDAVVGSDHYHHHVGHACSARAHRGERLVAGRVQEGHDLAAVMNLVGTDVLGDAARLAGGHLGLADHIQQRGLAVVDMPHDRDHRRTLDHILLEILELRLDLDVVGGVDDLDLLVELVGQHLDRVVGERLRERRHLAEHHQLLDHLGYRHAEILRDILDRGSGVDADLVGRLHRGRVDRRDRVVVGAAPAPSAAGAALGLVGRAALLAAGCLGVDHHTPASARPGAAGCSLARARVARGSHTLTRRSRGRLRRGFTRLDGGARRGGSRLRDWRSVGGGWHLGGDGGLAGGLLCGSLAGGRCGGCFRGRRRRRLGSGRGRGGRRRDRRGRAVCRLCLGGRAVAVGAERLQGDGLLDRGCRGLGLHAGGLQLLQQLFAG